MSAVLSLDFGTNILKKHISDVTTNRTDWIKISMSSGNSYWICNNRYGYNPDFDDKDSNFVIDVSGDAFQEILKKLRQEVFDV